MLQEHARQGPFIQHNRHVDYSATHTARGCCFLCSRMPCDCMHLRDPWVKAALAYGTPLPRPPGKKGKAGYPHMGFAYKSACMASRAQALRHVSCLVVQATNCTLPNSFVKTPGARGSTGRQGTTRAGACRHVYVCRNHTHTASTVVKTVARSSSWSGVRLPDVRTSCRWSICPCPWSPRVLPRCWQEATSSSAL